MKRGLTNFTYSLLSLSKLNDFYMNKRKNNKDNTNFILLNYHEISRKAFTEHIQYLDKKGEIITFKQFINLFKNKKYPSDPTFILTFDDGKHSFYETVFPVCENLQIPAIIYITTGPIINNEPFWWEKVQEIKKQEGGEIDDTELIMMTTEKRNNIINKKYNYNSKTGNSLNKKQIRELSKNKNIIIGSHTVTHTNLAKETEKNIILELKESKEYLENITNTKIIHFSYPNGDYRPNIIPLLSELGYETAVKVDDRWVLKQDNLFEIPRVGAGSYVCSVNGLETRIAGTAKKLKNLI
jgi:peptidoglycan/xylan/chitin deacetylase (PgdA/CDA1 family)